jgi:hypothetical protein
MGYHGVGSIAPVLYVIFRGGGLVLLWYFLTVTVILVYWYFVLFFWDHTPQEKTVSLIAIRLSTMSASYLVIIAPLHAAFVI